MDINKLFQYPNYIGIMDKEKNEVIYYCYDPEGNEAEAEWLDTCYRNDELKYTDNYFVYRVIQLDHQGLITNILFDRETEDIKCHIRTGRVISRSDGTLGVVVGDVIMFEDGSYDNVNEAIPYIDIIFENEQKGFQYYRDGDEFIVWEREGR